MAQDLGGCTADQEVCGGWHTDGMGRFARRRSWIIRGERLGKYPPKSTHSHAKNTATDHQNCRDPRNRGCRFHLAADQFAERGAVCRTGKQLVGVHDVGGFALPGGLERPRDLRCPAAAEREYHGIAPQATAALPADLHPELAARQLFHPIRRPGDPRVRQPVAQCSACSPD